jgi:hypothetical protein
VPKINIRNLNLDELPEPKKEKMIRRKQKEESQKETIRKNKFKQ